MAAVQSSVRVTSATRAAVTPLSLITRALAVCPLSQAPLRALALPTLRRRHATTLTLLISGDLSTDVDLARRSLLLPVNVLYSLSTT